MSSITKRFVIGSFALA